MATQRVSLRGLIAAGPQPADSGLFHRPHAAKKPAAAKPATDRLANVRQRLKERRRAKAAATKLNRDDAAFLRDIGAL
ncbi:MAG: hypothetical protein AAF721_30040 [Myxococcota bacterium]